MMNCITAVPVRMKHCADTRDDGHNECTHYRDDGYNSCSKWDSKCCDWWPCSWACKLITWFCVAWFWVSNLVCDAVQWVANIVCVLWDFITVLVCVPLAIVIAAVNYATGGYFGDFVNWIIGAKKAPNLVTPEDAKREVNQEGANGNPYDHLTWGDAFIAWFTTPVFKENDISGWTKYLLSACATGKAIQTRWNSDGLYTVDIEINTEYGEFVAALPDRDFTDGVEKTRWIRAEVNIATVGLDTPLPSTGQKVKICGDLFWDSDGFLEIHPKGAADVQILGPG